VGLLAKKPLQAVHSEAGGEHLRRVLGPWALTALGIGAVIGAGIFVTTGRAAHEIAGPALVVSYVVAGITCLLAALCYAEFAAMTPVAGSAYTYAYTTLGELCAWIIGWDLILEYAVGASTVANGWSAYFSNFLTLFPPDWGLKVPAVLNDAPMRYGERGMNMGLAALGGGAGAYAEPASHVVSIYNTGSWFNLPAVLVIGLLSAVLIKGIRESANFNAAMVAIKVGAVLFVIAVGAFFVNPDNWSNFAPYGWTGLSFFGIPIAGDVSPDGKPVGVLAGAAIIFFAYIGFDAVSTQAEEAKNPQKDVPFGIIWSLLICTVLYIGVVIVLTGMVKYDQLDTKAAVSQAFAQVGMPWAKAMISAAALAGLTSVLLVMLLGSARVLMAMSRDGMLPPFFSTVHPKFKTPWKGQAVVGVFAAVLAGFLPLDALLEMTNIGTLFAFAVVCGAVLVMRFANPDAPRPFRCPGVPFIPALGMAACLILMLSLPAENWLRLFVWMAIGLVIYFAYGRSHSRLSQVK
jgi:APA family basic amino acid/polyamine antiporter